MLKFGRAVTKKRKIILIIALLLLIPSAIGYFNTPVNYDILNYLPDSMETVEGQDILLDEFNKGGFAMVMFEGMSDKDVAKAKAKIEGVENVEEVIWYDTVLDPSTPQEILPDSVRDIYTNKETDSTLMAVFFNTPTSDEGSLNAVEDIREICGKQCFVSGMSAFCN